MKPGCSYCPYAVLEKKMIPFSPEKKLSSQLEDTCSRYCLRSRVHLNAKISNLKQFFSSIKVFVAFCILTIGVECYIIKCSSYSSSSSSCVMLRGLESSDRRLISSIGKTKRIPFFSQQRKKRYEIFRIVEEQFFFLGFLDFLTIFDIFRFCGF